MEYHYSYRYCFMSKKTKFSLDIYCCISQVMLEQTGLLLRSRVSGMIQKKLQDKEKDNYETACSHFHLTYFWEHREAKGPNHPPSKTHFPSGESLDDLWAPLVPGLKTDHFSWSKFLWWVNYISITKEVPKLPFLYWCFFNLSKIDRERLFSLSFSLSISPLSDFPPNFNSLSLYISP